MNKTATTERAEIKSLYAEVIDKTALQISLGDKYGVEPITVKNNWFGSLTQVPKKLKASVIDDLKEVISNQEL